MEEVKLFFINIMNMSFQTTKNSLSVSMIVQ